ncbi:hypothetical protein AGMMS50212_01120 [Spirochaetia bacterium]|nr:hypothetical protein AGMMS50212_01120 [Spirochaetia bacterium]
MASMIGIKVADGEFYPILAENTVAKKRLVLTTAHDNQKSVQIDLYRNPSGLMEKAQYMGTVVVENIPEQPKGEPSIELDIFSTEDGEITAEAFNSDDADNAEHNRLAVSLKSLQKEKSDIVDLPDFDLGFDDKEGDSNSADEQTKKKSSKNMLFLIGAAALLLLIIGFGLWFFVFKKSPQEITDASPVNTEQTAPPVNPVETPPVPVDEPPAEAVENVPEVKEEPAVTPPPVVKVDPPAAPPPPTPAAPPQVIKPVAPPPQAANASRKRAPAPVTSYKVPATIPKEGVSYKLAWGDTLWDVSAAFYRNPWYYKVLARDNGIRDPNKIKAGTTIKIPPRPR